MPKMNVLTRDDIKDQVYDIIKDTISIDRKDIADYKDFLYDDVMDMDSLDYLNIVMECEKTFNIELTDYEIEQTHTVGDLITLIEKKNPESLIVTKKPTRIQQFLGRFKRAKNTIINANTRRYTK